MMLPKEYHTNVVSWAKKNVARDVKRHSLRNALLITVSGDREKTAIWRLDDCELSGQTIRLQPIPARMSCDEILEWVGEEVLKGVPKPPPHPRVEARRPRRQLRWRGTWRGNLPWTQREPAAMRLSSTMTTTMSPPKWPVCAFVARNLSAGSKPGNWKPLQQGWKKQEKRDPRPYWRPSAVLWGVHTSSPSGLFRVLWEEERLQP